MNPKKRILIFSLAYFPKVGGAEIAIKEITDRIGEIDFDMVTMAFDGTSPSNEKIGNVNVYRVGKGSTYLNKVLFILRAAVLATKLNKEKKYDNFWAVMTYMLLPISLMRIFGGNKTPYLLTLQDGDPFSRVFNRLRILPFLPLLKYGFKNASKVQTISSFLTGWAKTMGFTGEVEVIPNGVDINLFSKTFSPDEKNAVRVAMGADDKSVVLITTSRLSYKNGIDTVINALQFLPSNIIFSVIGTGEEKENLEKLVKKLKLENRVKFLGFMPHERVVQYLASSDIFIRASRSEGMGNSFVEAMAVGIPVIGTNVGGIPDFLKDGETGFFCEPNNPKNISEVITKIINIDHDTKLSVIEKAHHLAVDQYNWDKISKDMAKVLNI